MQLVPARSYMSSYVFLYLSNFNFYELAPSAWGLTSAKFFLIVQ